MLHFTPYNGSAAGVPAILTGFDELYKFTWTTNDTTARRVEINVLTNRFGYRAGTEIVSVDGVVADEIFIDFVGSGCPCETDGAAEVNVFDLLAYLDLWFAEDPAAELDGQPGIDVFDLLEFLDCWFPASAGTPCP